MNYFSRKKNNLIFVLAGISALLCPKFAFAFGLSLNPELGYLQETFKNSQSEKSPFQGYSYGLGADIKSGDRFSSVRFMLTGFWALTKLTNQAVTEDTQTSSILGGGVGISMPPIKLRAGIVSAAIVDTYQNSVTNLGSNGTFVSASLDIYNDPAYQIELGLRYFKLPFSQIKNPSLGADLNAETIFIYLSIDFQWGLNIQDARGERKARSR